MRSVYSCHCDRSHDAESKRDLASRCGVIGWVLLFCLASAGFGLGQSISDLPGGNGKVVDGAVVRQSIEFGGHIVKLDGSQDMYNTLVNEQEGPRVLSQSLSVHPLPKTKTIFDDLYLDSFGWGGEPNNVARLRMEKRGIYRLTGSFRRDKNYFDYNLLANPLNPAGPVVNISPHAMNLTRRMYNFDLLLLPQRRLSFVLGYTRNRNEGPSFSSVHANRVDVLLFQPFSTTSDEYRMGVNWRILPRTTLSFLEALESEKYDTDQSLDTTTLPGGPFLDPASGLTSLTSYTRTQRYRVFIPTEQLSLTSSSIRNLEFTAHVAYSDANADTPLQENFTGTSSGGAAVSQNTNGTIATANWVTNEADFGATYHINRHLSLLDSFHFTAYRIPGTLNLFTTTTATSNQVYMRMSQQSTKSNEFTLQYEVSRNLGVRLGYLYRNTFDGHIYYVCASLINCQDPANLDEQESLTIGQHTAIGGVWYRMGRKLRANAEVRVTSSDDYLTRVDPRRELIYRANISYTPMAWLTMGVNGNVREQRNASQDFAYNAHWRNFGFNVLASPNNRLSFETDYEYTNIGQNANICYAYGAATPVSGSFFPCVNDTTGSASVYEVLGNYASETHFGSFNVIVKPVHRLTASAGYSVIAVDGSTLSLNPQQPTGPLSYWYHRPQASLALQVAKPVELRAGWNYYQYNENGGVGPAGGVTASRYFHANVTTLSMRYSF